MNINEGDKPWISKNKIYQPINKGGLNCIELESFFKSIKLNWIKRYTTNEYNDYWTDLLDELLQVTLATRKTILRWGSEPFSPAINRCRYPELKTPEVNSSVVTGAAALGMVFKENVNPSAVTGAILYR